jgi:hypothetical protein
MLKIILFSYDPKLRRSKPSNKGWNRDAGLPYEEKNQSTGYLDIMLENGQIFGGDKALDRF